MLLLHDAFLLFSPKSRLSCLDRVLGIEDLFQAHPRRVDWAFPCVNEEVI